MVIGSFEVGVNCAGDAISASGASLSGVSDGSLLGVAAIFSLVIRMSCCASSFEGSISSARRNSVMAPFISPWSRSFSPWCVCTAAAVNFSR